MRPSLKRILRGSVMVFSRTLLVLVVVLTCCQNKLIYHPRGYAAAYIQSRQAEPLRYLTSQGQQVAWMVNNAGRASPTKVWLAFSGNGTCALDMVPFFRQAAPLKDDLVVLVDYPSYGQSEGRPTPDNIRESAKAVLPAVATYLKTTPEALRPKLCVFGHSLGTASALMAMNELGIQRGTLVAPFTSMFDMARITLGWPLCCILHHRFDNVASLQQLQKRGGCQVQIVHGTDDEVIPQSQGRALAAAFPEIVTFHSAEDGSHNGILDTHRTLILEAMSATRRD